MLPTAAGIALILLSVSLALCAWRVIQGPTAHDRVLALDTAATNLIGVVVVASMRLGEWAYTDAVLVLAILGFISTVGFAKYLQKGVIIDVDDE